MYKYTFIQVPPFIFKVLKHANTNNYKKKQQTKMADAIKHVAGDMLYTQL